MNGTDLYFQISAAQDRRRTLGQAAVLTVRLSGLSFFYAKDAIRTSLDLIRP